MTKDQKHQVVSELVEKFKEFPSFYVLNAGGMSVAQVNDLRRKAFESNIPVKAAKNTLIRKALEQLDDNYDELYPLLKDSSTLLFATAENPSAPAKMLKEFRANREKPVLKVACIDTAVFAGDDQLEILTVLKSKSDLIGEIVGLLQSPAKNVVSALKSGGGKLAGILKTLSEREA